MSNQLIINPNTLPSFALPNDLVTKVREQLRQAAAAQTTSVPRISFSGRAFNLSMGDSKVELQDRTLDVFIVAIDPKFHYVFNEFKYDDVKNKDDKGRTMVRYPLPTDEVIYTPTQEFASRQYKQRCVVMLANDPTHKLYVVDFGYNSVKKVGNPNLGLFNLSQLINQFEYYSEQNPNILPFMFTVQMSFTKEVQPEIQFSLTDNRPQGTDANGNTIVNNQIRFADASAIEAMSKALTNGEVDNLMKIEYDSANQSLAQPAPVQPVYYADPQTEELSEL